MGLLLQLDEETFAVEVTKSELLFQLYCNAGIEVRFIQLTTDTQEFETTATRLDAKKVFVKQCCGLLKPNLNISTMSLGGDTLRRGIHVDFSRTPINLSRYARKNHYERVDIEEFFTKSQDTRSKQDHKKKA